MTTLLTFQHLPLLNNSVISCALTINNISLWVLTFNLFVNRSIYISFCWHPIQEAVSEEHFSTSDERCRCWCPFVLPALPWSIATISNRDLSVMSTFTQQGQKFMSLTFSLSPLMLEWAWVMFARNDIKSNGSWCRFRVKWCRERIPPFPDKNYFNTFNNEGHEAPQTLQKMLSGCWVFQRCTQDKVIISRRSTLILFL